MDVGDVDIETGLRVVVGKESDVSEFVAEDWGGAASVRCLKGGGLDWIGVEGSVRMNEGLDTINEEYDVLALEPLGGSATGVERSLIISTFPVGVRL